jgi:FkbM family methyltransferase
MRIERFYGHSVMVDGLNASSTVLDLGANYGNFALAIVNRFNCKPFCVEPDPDLYKILASNPALSAFNLAVTTRAGPARFYVAENSECSSLIHPAICKTIDEIECQGVTLEGLLTTIGIQRSTSRRLILKVSS